MKEGDPAAYTEADWRKSSLSEAGNCVEVAKPGDVVLVRDSRNPEGDPLALSVLGFTGFVALINAGEFNVRTQ